MFHLPWVGWYAAIEDLIDTLPKTRPAPWQLARLPQELRETLLIGPGLSVIPEPGRCVRQVMK